MTPEKLTEIIKAADQKAIMSKMQDLGYAFCNEHKKLGKVSVVELVKAIKFQTDNFSDEQNKRLYNGRICGTVKDYETYEFIYVNVYDVKPSTDPFDDEETAMQTEMLIWAKEIERR